MKKVQSVYTSTTDARRPLLSMAGDFNIMHTSVADKMLFTSYKISGAYA